jgi:hypothetical protein
VRDDFLNFTFEVLNFNLLKTPAFCGGRGEGREKQGQKMKKLALIIGPSLIRSRKIFINIREKCYSPGFVAVTARPLQRTGGPPKPALNRL